MTTPLPIARPRRNRASAALRDLTRETVLRPANLVLPLFLVEGEGREESIAAMPGCARRSIDGILAIAREAQSLGIPAVALFPAIPDALKDPLGSAAADPDGLVPRCVRALKHAVPDLAVITDVALDPYSSDGHDGVVVDGRIDNDRTLPLLARMAVVQAQAGADLVAPSDMMDGRVAAIRSALDDAGHSGTGILSYAVKYASAFYGPFRSALDSAPRSGDKKTYQMDPANAREALREAALDEAEGADVLMVKPGLPYLDILARLRQATTLPLAAYQVSGEYAMLQAGRAAGALPWPAALLESLLCLRRAGADMIFTYAALDAARALR